jgi:UDP-2,4-diacetamido-2,4,6-trideoxy-beta-L-altropyranose hydrolase
MSRVDAPSCLVRALANSTLGTGHLMRCRCLADRLRESGWRVGFWTDAESERHVALAPHSVTCEAPRPGEHDVVVFDGYDFGAQDEAPFVEGGAVVVVIDDLADRAHTCHLVVDANLGATRSRWAELAPEADVLAGLEYALIRPEFARLRGTAATFRPGGEGPLRVVVSYGGVDPRGISSAAVEALSGLVRAGVLEVDLFVGANAPSVAQLRSLVAARGDGFRLHVGSTAIAEALSGADLALGAGGTSAWERCVLGVPTLVAVLADNQRGVAQALIDAGAAWLYDPRAADDEATLVQVIRDPERRRVASTVARSLCDGEGASRVERAVRSALVPRGRGGSTPP